MSRHPRVRRLRTGSEALDVSYQLLRKLRGPLEKLRRSDPQLYRQVRRAASSVVLNLAEGNRHLGKSRLHHFRIAAGSADEVRAALVVAECWGDVSEVELREAMELLDRVLAMTWRLTH